jgi:hypothetical protein
MGGCCSATHVSSHDTPVPAESCPLFRFLIVVRSAFLAAALTVASEVVDTRCEM